MNTGWENARGRLLALHALEKAMRDMERGDGFLYGNAGAGAMWTDVLNEELEESVGAEYERLRDAEAPLVHGLVHVRNGVAHAAAVTTQDGGLSLPFTLPVTIPAPAWLPITDVHRRWTPRGLRSPRVIKRIEMYERYMEGRDPADTLRTAIAFFRALEQVDWVPADFRGVAGS